MTETPSAVLDENRFVRFTCDAEETILQLRSFSEQLKQLQFVPQDPKKVHFPPFQDGKLQVWFWCERQIHVVASKIASLLFMAVCEEAKWTHQKHLHSAGNDSKFWYNIYNTWDAHVKKMQCKENLYPMYLFMWYAHLWPFQCHLLDTKKKKNPVCVLLSVWLTAALNISLALVPQEGARAQVKPCTRLHLWLTLAVITVYWRKSSSSSSSSSLLWEVDASPVLHPSATCREMMGKICKLQIHKWALKNYLKAEIHTLTHTREHRAVLPVVE